MEEIRQWHRPFEEWSLNCCGEFVTWVAGYSKENPDLKLEEAVTAFRMVMDAGYYEEPKSLLTAEAITNQALKVLEEELAKAYEYNQFRL